jgi:hypothetical protein
VTTPSRNPALIFWIILFAALLVLFAAFNPPTKHLLLNLIPMLAAFGFALTFIGIGSVPARILIKDQSIGIRILTSLAFGIGLTGAFVFLLGFGGLFRAELFLGWILLGAVLFIYSLRTLKIDFTFPESFNAWSCLSLAAFVLFLIPGLPFFVAPEISIDATEYHLLIPKMWLRMNGIKFIPLFVESNYPPLASLIYLMILPLASDIACKCFHLVMAISIVFLMAQFSKKLGAKHSLFFASAMFISMPIAYVVAGWAWNDLFFTFFILLGLYFLIEFHESQKSTNVVVAGISIGLAACTKYSFLLYFPAIVSLAILGIIFWRWSWKNMILFFVPIGILSLSWITKNWIFTGNPFFPFLNEIFQSPHWTENVDRYFKEGLSRYEMGEWSRWNYILFPFLLTLKPRIIDVHTGVLPLITAFLLLRKSTLEKERILKCFVVLSVLSWLIFQTMTRSLLPVLAVILVLGSVAIQEISWKPSFLRRLCIFLIGVSMALNFYVATITTQHLFDPFRHFIGAESRSQYLTRMSTAQPIYDTLNGSNDVRQVLLVSLHNPFYLNKSALFSSCCDPPIVEILTEKTSTSSDIAEKMKRLGISHVVVRLSTYASENKNGLYNWDKNEKARFEEFLIQHCIEIKRDVDLILYRIK